MYLQVEEKKADEALIVFYLRSCLNMLLPHELQHSIIASMKAGGTHADHGHIWLNEFSAFFARSLQCQRVTEVLF